VTILHQNHRGDLRKIVELSESTTSNMYIPARPSSRPAQRPGSAANKEIEAIRQELLEKKENKWKKHAPPPQPLQQVNAAELAIERLEPLSSYDRTDIETVQMGDSQADLWDRIGGEMHLKESFEAQEPQRPVSKTSNKQSEQMLYKEQLRVAQGGNGLRIDPHQPVNRQSAKANGQEHSDFQKKLQNYTLHKLIIRLCGSVNGCRDVGLCRIKLFDTKGSEIMLERENIQTQGNCLTPLYNIIQPNPYTNNSQEMWLTEFPLLSDQVDLRVNFYGPTPGILRVWNYNAERGKGTKAIEVIINGIPVLSQPLLPAPVAIDRKYHQDLTLDPSSTRAPSPPPPTHFLPSSPSGLMKGPEDVEKTFNALFDRMEKDRMAGYNTANTNNTKPQSMPAIKDNYSRRREQRKTENYNGKDRVLGARVPGVADEGQNGSLKDEFMKFLHTDSKIVKFDQEDSDD
jgi:hypothetical protein